MKSQAPSTDTVIYCLHCGEPIYLSTRTWYHVGVGFQRCAHHAAWRVNSPHWGDGELMATPDGGKKVIDLLLEKYK